MSSRNMTKQDEAGVLELSGPINSWDEAVPLGNGLLGMLLWGGKKHVRISLDRADLWDNRMPEPFTKPDWNWPSLLALVREKKWKEIAKRFITPGQSYPYPTKLPAGRLFVDLPASRTVSLFRLDRQTAMGVASWKGGELEAFCEAAGDVACLRFRGHGVEWRLEPPPYTRKENQPGNGMGVPVDLVALGYPAASTWRIQNAAGFSQETISDGAFAVAVSWRKSEGWTELFIAVESGADAETAREKAMLAASMARDRGWEKILAAHQRRWKQHWSRSRVQIPDEALMDHYRQVIYFLGSVSRPGGPPISLQAVWTADDGRLPPWKGDYHHNLNTQLSYWPHLTAGHGDRLRGFLDFMKNLEPVHRDLARRFFGADGIFVPGAMGLDGQLIGGYAQVAYSPTNGAWVAQLFHQYWKYTLDPEFLRTHAYPYCLGTAQLLAALLEKDPDGKLRLPLSASPEIHEGGPQGWVSANSNYDLALMHWNFSAVAEMARELGESDTKWVKILAKLEPLAVADKTGDEIPQPGTGPFLIAPGKPLHESHRHHSHLMGIYPLGLVSVEDDENTQKAIEESFHQIDKLGTGLWVGFSFTWMACLAARCRRPERARKALQNFVESFISRNGFHLNGDYRKRGLSWWNYRPFTLEANFAFVEGVNEMLLQSWRGVLRIFPAVPDDWEAASFDQLRAEGSLTVSADRKGGQTHRVKIRAGEKCRVRLVDPFDGTGRWNKKMRQVRGLLECSLAGGEILLGTAEVTNASGHGIKREPAAPKRPVVKS